VDPITHAISGAVLARALPRQRLPTAAVLFLVIMTMLPDIDFILRLFSERLYLTYHRSITHSILLLPIWVWLCYSLVPRRRRQYPVMPWLIAAAFGLHILFDLITSYGTMILAPFSDMRFTGDLIFIIDPFFTLILLLPLLFALLWPNKGRRLCILAFVGIAAYLALAYSNHQHALLLARQQQPDAQEIAALPLPFSPFRWQLIASFPDRYRRAGVDFSPAFSGSRVMLPARFTQQYSEGVRAANDLDWLQFPSLNSLSGIDGLPGVPFYRWFARFPVLLQRDNESLELADLRFFAGPLRGSPFRLRVRISQGGE